MLSPRSEPSAAGSPLPRPAAFLPASPPLPRLPALSPKPPAAAGYAPPGLGGGGTSCPPPPRAAHLPAPRGSSAAGGSPKSARLRREGRRHSVGWPCRRAVPGSYRLPITIRGERRDAEGGQRGGAAGSGAGRTGQSALRANRTPDAGVGAAGGAVSRGCRGERGEQKCGAKSGAMPSLPSERSDAAAEPLLQPLCSALLCKWHRVCFAKAKSSVVLRWTTGQRGGMRREQKDVCTRPTLPGARRSATAPHGPAAARG